jgi:hypothetical protein
MRPPIRDKVFGTSKFYAPKAEPEQHATLGSSHLMFEEMIDRTVAV